MACVEASAKRVPRRSLVGRTEQEKAAAKHSGYIQARPDNNNGNSAHDGRKGCVAFGLLRVVRRRRISDRYQGFSIDVVLLRTAGRFVPRRHFVSLAALLVAGCAEPAVSGPTGQRSAKPQRQRRTLSIHSLKSKRLRRSLPRRPSGSCPGRIAPPPTDLLGPGDVLNITVYEAGVSLFGTALRTAAAAGSTAIDTSSSAERLPAVRVDDYGYIRVPFVGRLRAAGHTAAELQSIIQNGLTRHVAGSPGAGHDRAIDHQQHHPRWRGHETGTPGARYEPEIPDRCNCARRRLPGQARMPWRVSSATDTSRSA